MSSLADLKGMYVIDVAHSRLGFSTRYAMVTKVRGGFSQFEGTAQLDGDDPAASKVDVTQRWNVLRLIGCAPGAEASDSRRMPSCSFE